MGMDHEDSAHTNPRFGKKRRNAGAGKRERGGEKASKWEEDPRVWKSLGARV